MFADTIYRTTPYQSWDAYMRWRLRGRYSYEVIERARHALYHCSKTDYDLDVAVFTIFEGIGELTQGEWWWGRMSHKPRYPGGPPYSDRSPEYQGARHAVR